MTLLPTKRTMKNAEFEVLIEVLLKIQFVWRMTSCR